MNQAKSHLDEAFKVAEELNDYLLKADILNNLGGLNCDLLQLDEAIKNYEQST